MISADGAALIATLLPIAVLLLSFEARALLRAMRPKKSGARWAFVTALVLVLGAGLSAVNICVGAVASGEALDGALAVFVGWTASAIGALTGGAVSAVVVLYVFTDVVD